MCRISFRWEVEDSEADVIGNHHLGRSVRGVRECPDLMNPTALLGSGWKMLKVGIIVIGLLDWVLVIYLESNVVSDSVSRFQTHVRCNLSLLRRTKSVRMSCLESQSFYCRAALRSIWI